MLADVLHTVISADREIYTREVVERLQNQAGVIRASQHYLEHPALPIPAIMVRLGAELAQRRDPRFSYGLISPWPINKDNAPHSTAEELALASVIDAPERPSYDTEIRPDGVRQLIAVYPDIAVSPACIDCHSRHPDSPRHDFKLGEVMGGLVVRVALR